MGKFLHFFQKSQDLCEKLFLTYFRHAESESVVKNGGHRQKFGEKRTLI